MENLSFIHRGQSISKKIAGVLSILLAIMILPILDEGSLEIRDWIRSIVFFLIGIFSLTRVSGSNKVEIVMQEESLKILWLNWIREVTIQETEIENIILSTKNILISRREKKALKLDFNYLTREQKAKIHKFMIEYARQKNLVLKK